MRNILIVVVGPTGIGKTSWAIRLAEYFQTEIISADSRQFYSEMTIGTAVPSKEELQRVRHHFIQHLSIFHPWSVGDFEREAIELLSKLFNGFNVVIAAGGSGLYVQALLKGLDHFPEVSGEIRSNLIQLQKEAGIKALQKKLKDLDPDYYEIVDMQNPHRLIRALEVCLQSGKPYSSFLGQQQPSRAFLPIVLGLEAGRDIIYQRIDHRVDRMMSEGLLEEAEQLYPHRGLNALQTVGYQELFSFLDGKWDLSTAVEEIKKNSRRYAKRQLSWFKRDKSVHWLDYQMDITRMTETVEKLIDEIQVNDG